MLFKRFKCRIGLITASHQVVLTSRVASLLPAASVDILDVFVVVLLCVLVLGLVVVLLVVFVDVVVHVVVGVLVVVHVVVVVRVRVLVTLLVLVEGLVRVQVVVLVHVMLVRLQRLAEEIIFIVILLLDFGCLVSLG